MNTKIAIFIMVFFISTSSVMLVFGAGAGGKTLLPDGFILRDVRGKLVRHDNNNVWLFKFNFAMNDKKEVPDINEALEVLSTSALEAAITDVNLSTSGYRLWGRVTKYKSRNFLFPNYFLPISSTQEPNSSAPELSQETVQKTVQDSNDDLGIPQEILEKLRVRQRPPPAARKLQDKQKIGRQDSILVDRMGFLVRQTDGTMVFNLDALGRGVQADSFSLLPCQTLEHAEQIQSAEPDPVRFRVAGIVTEYKDQIFLLLERATRVYSYGNFNR